MGLDTLVESAVAIANTVTESLQVGGKKLTLKHAAWLGTFDANGKPKRKAAVPVQALFEKKQRLVRIEAGSQVLSRSRLTFLSPITITEYDELTHLGKPVGPILEIESLINPTTDKPYYAMVWLG